MQWRQAHIFPVPSNNTKLLNRKVGGLMFKRSRIVLLFGVAVAVSLIISACGSSGTGTGSTPTVAPTATVSTVGTPGSYNCIAGTIAASGLTALAPLVKAVATAYTTQCSSATITVNLGGSKTGLANVEAGSSDIGNSDVPANTSTQADLVDHQVSVVIFGIIVNKDVTLTDITTAQLKDIYSGKTTNWNQIGGPNLPIVLVSPPASSGTRATFAKYILSRPETVSGPSHLTTDSTGVVITNVAAKNGPIVYAGTGPA